jgi:glycerol uptake facilitator-like aquaporin
MLTSFAKECLAEFLGTMFLVYVILATGHFAANGAALAVAIYVTAGICKQSFNPAVSVALVKWGALPMASLVPYIISETLGALAAVMVLATWRQPGKYLPAWLATY